MRDNVTRLGTLYSALALPVNKTSITGTSVDLSLFNAATVYIVAGAWTDGVHNFIIEESADNTVWTPVAAADLVAWSATSPTNPTPIRLGNATPTAISSAATAVNQRLGYIGALRYLRLRTNVTGAPATGAAYDAFIVTGEPRVIPSAV